jgi:hypothetical protein
VAGSAALEPLPERLRRARRDTDPLAALTDAPKTGRRAFRLPAFAARDGSGLTVLSIWKRSHGS